MRLLFVLLCLFIHQSILVAQNEPQLSVEGVANIIFLENESFEVDLGNFMNEGILNWSVTNLDANDGVQSATSNPVFAGQDAILKLDIGVPAGYNAFLSFSFKSTVTEGPDNINNTRSRFQIDGVNQFENTAPVNSWKEQDYYIDEGMHTLTWSVNHDSDVSDDQIQMFLDQVVILYNSNPTVRIQDGSEGIGRVLMSDAYGNATWSTLSAVASFDNATSTPGALVPLLLDGNNQITIPLKVYNAFGSGILSEDNLTNGIIVSNNGGSGLSASNNGGDGVRTFANSDDGVEAILNSDDGFEATLNNSDGFEARENGVNGFYATKNAQHGFFSFDNDVEGFSAVANDGYGFRAISNGVDGFSAEANTDDGFNASANVDEGFVAENNGDNGFLADNNTDYGFFAIDNGLDGLWANSNDDDGVQSSSNADDGIYSIANGGDEGYFSGTVTVTGNLSKGGGSFKIDHPLDPENKFLYHSFVESPDMMNVYNGNVILDQNGEAVVEMEAWFQPLNRDFRYQLTCIGGFAPVYIAEKIQNNRFKIAGGTPGMEVSWQVTGVRQDPYANQHRIEVEVDKPAKFKGYYLHPNAYRKDFSKGFNYVKLGYKTLEEVTAEEAKKVESKPEQQK